LTTELTRDFTVVVFVIDRGHVLLHRHLKLGLWLPPGGHIEPNELPDEAALREVREEAGIDVALTGGRGLNRDLPDEPRQLVRPEGIQLELISPGHEHIDLIYFARPMADGEALPEVLPGMQWVDEDGLGRLDITDEVAAWSRKALAALRLTA
jgi:8-oxo-dGTP pyrophosphatase MutT (NUDIX family)